MTIFYWIATQIGTISSYYLESDEIHVLERSLKSPLGIVVDAWCGHIYFTDCGSHG